MMTTEEKDKLLGTLMREQSEACRLLGCLRAKKDRYERQLTLAQAVLSKRMRLIPQDDGIRVGYWDSSEQMETFNVPSTEEVVYLITEVSRVECLIEDRKGQIDEIAPGCG